MGSSLTGHVVTALVSSALTAGFMQWRHSTEKESIQRLCVVCGGSKTCESVSDKSVQNSDCDAAEIVENGSDDLYDNLSKKSNSSDNEKEVVEDDDEFKTDICLDKIIEEKFRPKSKRSTSVDSFAGSFINVDGVNREDEVDRRFSTLSEDSYDCQDDRFSTNNSIDSKIEVLSEEEWLVDNKAVQRAKEFDEKVLSKITDLKESRMMLRRMHAVYALASTLVAAPDEKTCFEEVTRLLVILFGVDGAAYGLLKDSEHWVMKQSTVKNKNQATKVSLEFGNRPIPLKNSAMAVCQKTLEQLYVPRTGECPLPNVRVLIKMGVGSLLCTPILVNGNKFAGAIFAATAAADGLSEYDRILINDVGTMLGANIYSKRLKESIEKSNKISKEMLHSMIPPKVIDKIECFWDTSSDEYRRRQSCLTNDNDSTAACSLDESECSRHKLTCSQNDDVMDKINFLRMNRSDGENEDVGVVLDMSGMELGTSSQALYAENVDNVVILFADIVGFSRMSMTMKPIQVVDMLQDLFSRFDELCDTHDVKKLETIGDAYICTAGLFDDCDVKTAAKNVLDLAKDMIKESQNVKILCRRRKGSKEPRLFESPEIRVGIHIGNATCGVLGQRLPKFTVFGNAVNLAARMEQASEPGKIRVTEEFHSLVSDIGDNDWSDYDKIPIKNMGEVGTYMLDARVDLSTR